MLLFLVLWAVPFRHSSSSLLLRIWGLTLSKLICYRNEVTSESFCNGKAFYFLLRIPLLKVAGGADCSKQCVLSSPLDDGEKQQKHSKLSSKTSPKESSQAPAVPWLDQECPSDKERFIPPELSIWDYFIAKVLVCYFESLILLP